MQGQMLGEGLKLQALLLQKVMKVVSNVEKIEKSGYNSHQNYHYSTENDLVNAVRNLLIENKLLVLTDSETKEVIKLNKFDKEGKIVGENLVTVVNTRHTFCDTETGYSYPVQSTGTGFDNTDKGSFKAITGAMKYFISKNFLVPTEDDPENDGTSKKVSAPKGFNRSSQVAAKVTTEVKAEEPKVVENVEQTSTTTETFSKSETTQAKPRFQRRQTSKQEPSFP